MDPRTDIITLRDSYRKQGLEFDIHVDAAWGGSMLSMVRKDFGMDGGDLKNPFIADTHLVPMSDDAVKQFEAIRRADSVPIDPQKSGYIQYPAGALCDRSKLRTSINIRRS